MDSKEKMLAKAAKIKKLAESEKAVGNEEAAKNMAAMLQRLLIQHQMTMAEVEATASSLDRQEEEIIESYFDMNTTEIGRKNRRSRWSEVLGGIVARACGCQILVMQGTNNLVFVGPASSTEMAKFSFTILLEAAERISIQAYEKEYAKMETTLAQVKRQTTVTPEQEKVARATMKGYRFSFLMGFCERVKERFDEELEKPTEGISTALMVIGNSLTRTNDYIQSKFCKKAAPLTGPRLNHVAMGDGRKAADKVGFTRRPVGSDNPSKHQLGG